MFKSLFQKALLIAFFMCPFYSFSYSYNTKNVLKKKCNDSEAFADLLIAESRSFDYWYVRALNIKLSCLFLKGDKEASPFSQPRMDHDEAYVLMQESINLKSVYAQHIKAHYVETGGHFGNKPVVLDKNYQ